jgi:F0F1-type ATP synthase membrane subunit b/b'
MFAFFYNLLLLAAEGAHGAEANSPGFFERYFNYSGFELWKFINLAIFVAFMIYVLKKPLGEAFKAKREAIRSELIKAEEEKQAALAQLTSAEAKLVSLNAEKAEVLKRAQAEAEAEKANIAMATDNEVAKMREQAEGEINRLAQQTKAELRKFSAEESVRLAEEKLRGKINADNDAVLVKSGIQAIGGLG